LNQIRKHFRDSVIFLGKNKVMALALGKDEASEVGVNVSKIATRLEVRLGCKVCRIGFDFLYTF